MADTEAKEAPKAPEAEERVAQLQDQLDKLRAHLAMAELEATQSRAEVDRLVDISKAQASSAKQETLYVSQPRRVDRFRDRPEKVSDPSIQEWVADARASMDARKLGGMERRAFLIENLGGKARQEILGRGDSLDGEEILTILVKVFGEGDTLPQVQQKFFAYQQGDGEDLLACSLALVRLYGQIEKLDSSYKSGRDAALKGRLAEAVADQGLQRELRRLNLESTGLGYFDLRDRAIQWLGHDGVKKKEARVREAQAESALQEVMRQQAELLAKQQEQISALTEAVNKGRTGGRRPQGRGPRQCWICQSPDHLKRDCPKAQGTEGQRQSLN